MKCVSNAVVYLVHSVCMCTTPRAIIIVDNQKYFCPLVILLDRVIENIGMGIAQFFDRFNYYCTNDDKNILFVCNLRSGYGFGVL